jgi:acyl carrier protein
METPMDRTEIRETVRVALSTVLNRQIDRLDDEQRLLEDLSLDSTGVIELLMSLEDSAGLLIDPDELQPEVFATVRTLIDYVEAGTLAEPLAADA